MRVAVIGGGVDGAATAWRLATRGVDVVCFDRFSPPHAEGSSHGESRMIRTAYAEGAWYVPLLQEVFPLWRELEAATGSQILNITGALYLGSPAAELVAGALASAREHGLDVELLDSAALRKRYRGHVAGDGDVGVLDRQAGFLDPEAAVAAMLSLVPEVRRNTEVASIAELRRQFDAVVVAAGPWTPELVDWLPLKVERQAQAWFALARDASWFAPNDFPAFIRETEMGDYYGFPTLDGKSVKVARSHGGETTDPHRIRRRVDDADLDPIRLFASKHMRGVSGHAMRTLTCMYTNTPDLDFVIDLSPEDERVVVVSACSGHGFKFGPIVGDIAADLVIDGRTERDISHFSARRFAAAPQVPDDHRDDHKGGDH